MKTQTQGSYCSVTRSLEVVGERWSLLVVRDLLPGSQRFSDLLSAVAGITPKLLTLRLRDLEANGVVHRDEEAGRRDVWYSLTESGLALRPVIRELVIWGIYHGQPPQSGETARSRRGATSCVAVFNREGLTPSKPLTWAIDFGDGSPSPFRFDGRDWDLAPDASPADVELVISSTPKALIGLFRTPRGERAELARSIDVQGSEEQIENFRGLFAA